MKKLMVVSMVAMLVCLMCEVLSADTYVGGYYRSSGTYATPHYRSNPDGNFYNNYSTYGNVNPYTGAYGTRRTPSTSYRSSYNYSVYVPSRYSSYPYRRYGAW